MKIREHGDVIFFEKGICMSSVGTMRNDASGSFLKDEETIHED